jgi:lipoate-protein ligase A
MALDEALLECHDGAPTLRLYAWRPAAISLGRFQELASVASLPAAIPRVRRLTGGGAIYHREDEVTYSIVAPYAAFGGKVSPRVAYGLVHEAIAKGLTTLGVPLPPTPTLPPLRAGRETAALCYDAATDYDLKAGAKKLVGSAQRRKGASFLQHGSLPLSPDPFSAGAISLSQLLGEIPRAEDVRRAVRDAIARAFAVGLEPGRPTERELELARRLERERYASRSWTETG